MSVWVSQNCVISHILIPQSDSSHSKKLNYTIFDQNGQKLRLISAVQIRMYLSVPGFKLPKNTVYTLINFNTVVLSSPQYSM